MLKSADSGRAERVVLARSEQTWGLEQENLTSQRPASQPWVILDRPGLLKSGYQITPLLLHYKKN